MSQKCTACQHPKRSELDSLLVTGSPSLQSIAARFGLSKTALARHRKRHLARQAQKAIQKLEERNVVKVADRLESLFRRHERLLEQAEETADSPEETRDRISGLSVANQLHRELRGSLQLAAELSWENKAQQSGSPVQLLIVIPSQQGPTEASHKPQYGPKTQMWPICHVTRRPGVPIWGLRHYAGVIRNSVQ